MTLPEGRAKGRALFVRRAKFSHVNQSLLSALRRQRPDIQFDDVDLDDLIPAKSPAFLGCIMGAVAEYGPSCLRNRNRLRFSVLRSRAYYRLSQRLIRERSLSGDYLFTVQTQSLFNAANGRVPNLIYTDHAALAREASQWDEGLGEPSPAWLELEAEIYADAAHVFTFGNRVRRVLIERYGMPEERVTCAGTGANVMPDTPPDLSPARYAGRSILFAGIEWERKGGPDLLAAFRILRSRLPDATLTVLGCSPPEAQGIPGCRALGRLPLPDLARHYRDASCFCVPSRHEPFGNVFVEAGHFGLPVVATRVGEIGDVVHDGRNGYRVPPGDPTALADALWQVLHDPKAASRMGQAGTVITADYTWDKVAEKMLAQAPLT